MSPPLQSVSETGEQSSVPSNEGPAAGGAKNATNLELEGRGQERDLLQGIDVPATGHIRAIPAWWWLVRPWTAFRTLLAMKEQASSRVAKEGSEEGYTPGSGSAEEAKGGSSPGEKLKLDEGISLPMVGDIKWSEMVAYIVDWISNPLNMALTFWCILCIVPSIIILMVESGALDAVIRDEFIREEYVENSNQILNALFVLMCLVWNPVFFRLSYQLYRWSPTDISQLRQEYSRGGRRKPNEWWHLAVIFFWFHMTCIATYALATVYWVYNRWNRPSWAVILTVLVSFGSPVIAFTYNIMSPLGKDFYLETVEDETAGSEDPSAPRARRSSSELFRESKMSFILSHKVVPYPTWRGEVVAGCCQKPALACFTCCFPFCVFGLNSQRLGFGSAWVQTASFILIVAGPCLVFEISAHTTKLYDFQRVMTYMGLCLAWLGLLYGAFWRYKMRTKFRLPRYTWCLGSAVLTDAALWLFCCWCTLCQEVRTAEYYDIGDNTFFEKSEEERRRMAEQELGLGRAGKKVAEVGGNIKEGLAEVGENIKGGLEGAGRGVVRILSEVGNRVKRIGSSGSLQGGDLESGRELSGGSHESTSSSDEAMAVPETPKMEGGGRSA